MPTWNQIQNQLKSTKNPVVFFDVAVGTTVRKIDSLHKISETGTLSISFHRKSEG